MLQVVVLLNFLRKHVGDNKYLLREALILVDQDLLIFEILVLFLFDLLGGFKKRDAQLLTALLRVLQMINDVSLFVLDVFVELKFLI